ncbi:MAG: DUF393 domain-containing protein [Nitrospira sp.]|nr:DUF393 domain-containing protein [Nitrospira sp.]
MSDEHGHTPGALLRRSSGTAPEACLLIYDDQCRFCVTAKNGLERLEPRADAAPLRMVPYQNDEAKQALGEAYRPGRPDVAFFVRPDGEIISGLDAMLAFLPGLKGGRGLVAILRFPLIRPFSYLLYRFVARYRYRIFGTVLPVESSKDS